MDDAHRESIETSARFLYGLIHARYIVTSRGLQKMVSVDNRARGRHSSADGPKEGAAHTPLPSFVRLESSSYDPATYLCSELTPARQVQEGRLRALPARLLLWTEPAPCRTDGHPLPEGRQALLPAMRGHLLAQVEPTRLHRRRLLWHDVSPHALHGVPADDPQQGPAVV